MRLNELHTTMNRLLEAFGKTEIYQIDVLSELHVQTEGHIKTIYS